MLNSSKQNKPMEKYVKDSVRTSEALDRLANRTMIPKPHHKR